MNTSNVTITSKNQITLPSSYVKHLKLSKNRVLQAKLSHGQIVLTPQPLLQDSMEKFWSKHNAKSPVSDKDLKEAARLIASTRAM